MGLLRPGPRVTLRRPITALCAVAAVVGLVVLVAAAGVLLDDRSTAADFGRVPSSGPAAARPGATGAEPAGTSGSASPTLVPAPGTRPVPAPPARIQIAALHVDAPVVRVQLSSGSLDVPADPATVGWWTRSALPGSGAGVVVLDGHVDSATRGLGAFFRLTMLQPSDVISVTTVRGTQVDYRVTARRTYPKSAGLPADLFRGASPQLLLITCGGPFDRTTLSYEDNIVIIATPATAA